MIGAWIPWGTRSDTPGYLVAENGCHLWTGNRGGAHGSGYGYVRFHGEMKLVHRVRYEQEIGPIPPGMQLDHYVCDNGAGGCVNPLHCRPVSHYENMMRGDTVASMCLAKTHCPKGHPLAGDNLVPSRFRRGERLCRTCANTYARERYHRRSAA